MKIEWTASNKYEERKIFIGVWHFDSLGYAPSVSIKSRVDEVGLPSHAFHPASIKLKS